MPQRCARCPPFNRLHRRAGGDHVVPSRASATRTRHDVIEGEIVARTAILALEAVAQEHVEPREGRIARRLDVGLQRHDRRQVHFHADGTHLALVFGDDVNAIEEYGLDRVPATTTATAGNSSAAGNRHSEPAPGSCPVLSRRSTRFVSRSEGPVSLLFCLVVTAAADFSGAAHALQTLIRAVKDTRFAVTLT